MEHDEKAKMNDETTRTDSVADELPFQLQKLNDPVESETLGDDMQSKSGKLENSKATKEENIKTQDVALNTQKIVKPLGRLSSAFLQNASVKNALMSAINKSKGKSDLSNTGQHGKSGVTTSPKTSQPDPTETVDKSRVSKVQVLSIEILDDQSKKININEILTKCSQKSPIKVINKISRFKAKYIEAPTAKAQSVLSEPTSSTEKHHPKAPELLEPSSEITQTDTEDQQVLVSNEEKSSELQEAQKAHSVSVAKGPEATVGPGNVRAQQEPIPPKPQIRRSIAATVKLALAQKILKARVQQNERKVTENLSASTSEGVVKSEAPVTVVTPPVSKSRGKRGPKPTPNLFPNQNRNVSITAAVVEVSVEAPLNCFWIFTYFFSILEACVRLN